MKKLVLSSFLLIAWLLSVSAATIKGVVVDKKGETILGATVIVKNTTNGTVTNLNGEFTLQISEPSKAILVVSFIGLQTKEVKVDDKTFLKITLEDGAIQLDEVVAIGYGSSKRKDLTGSVVSVRTEDISKVPTANIGQALAGRVAGVQVSQTDGEPGAAISIRVRGGISITQSNEPLYIVDGFPMEDGLNTIDPGDIESIDILKDASSTAIYGSRGANGVIVITTKSNTGTKEKLSVSYENFLGFKTISKWLDVLSPQEFVFADLERTKDDVARLNTFTTRYGARDQIIQNWGTSDAIDWQQVTLGRETFTQNHRITLNGGGKELKYNLSYSRFDDKGFMPNSDFTKNNFKLRVDHNSSKKVSISANVNYDDNRVRGLGTSESGERFNKMNHILQYRPVGGLTLTNQQLLEGEDPALLDDQGNAMQNPLISAEQEKKDVMTRTFMGGGSLKIKIFKNLSFSSNIGLRYQNRRTGTFMGERSSTAIRNGFTSGRLRNDEYGSFQLSNVFQHDYKNKKHTLTSMIGQEYVSRWSQYFEASADKFPNNDIGLNNMGVAEVAGKPYSGFNDDDRILSFFGRMNYSYSSKYILSVSLRADGSSKFGANHKWGYFPAASAAWRISDEKLIKDLHIFSDLKLRAGYGLAGNNRIASYLSLAVLSPQTYPIGNVNGTGYASSQIPNSDLRWEANQTLNLGLDMGFLNQRITLTPEVYLNRSNDLLLSTALPLSSGFTTMMQNIGATENKGIDLTINTVNIQKKNFRWTTNFNISRNINKVIALSGEQKFLTEAVFGYNQKNYVVEVGQPLGRMYGFITEGLYTVDDFDYNTATKTYTIKPTVPHNPSNKPQPGSWKFKNVDASDNVINDNDRTVMGDANPLFYGGLTNNFTIGNFDFSFFINYSYGNDILNATKLYNSLVGGINRNALNVVNSANRWVNYDITTGQKIVDPEILASMNQGKKIASIYDLESGDLYIHSWAVEDGSFIRLNNVTLGYSLPKSLCERLNIQKLRLYGTANNLYVFTKYTGYDPEVGTRNSNLTPGVDWGAYPRSLSVVFGLNVIL